MILGLFGLGDRGRAKELARLAKQTIRSMELTLRELPEDSPDRAMVESHLSRRVKQLERYSMLARGKSDDMERIVPPLRNYETWKRSMESEIGVHARSIDAFIWYLRQVKRPD